MSGMRVATFALNARDRPKVTDALIIGELMHAASVARSHHQLVTGQDAERQPLRLHHRHVSIFPLDMDGDHRIETIVVYAAQPFPQEFFAGLPSIQKLWLQRGGPEWRLELQGVWKDPTTMDLGLGGTLFLPRRMWKSVTPYYHPWYAKRDFGYPEQVQRECRLRSWTVPQVCFLAGKSRAALQFRSSRIMGGNDTARQPDKQGRFCLLRFPEAIDGPVALGYGCHFGLGLFAPCEESDLDQEKNMEEEICK